MILQNILVKQSLPFILFLVVTSVSNLFAQTKEEASKPIAAEKRTPIPCNISDEALQSEMRHIYSQAIEKFLRHAKDQLEFPKNYELFVKFGGAFHEQLLRNHRCEVEHPGNLCAISSELFLSAQDWDETWEVEKVDITKSKNSTRVTVFFRDRAERFKFTEPSSLSLACEGGELVVTDFYSGGGSRLESIRKELDQLGVK